MASTIRVRATNNGDITEVQALIQHPMDSGFVKDAKGEIVPAHFIQQLTFEYDGKPVFVADWGGGVGLRVRLVGGTRGRCDRRGQGQRGKGNTDRSFHTGSPPVSHHWIFAAVESVAPLLSTQLILRSSPFLAPLNANFT